MSRCLRDNHLPRLAVMGVLALASIGVSAVRAQQILTPKEWEEDLDFLVKTVSTKHRCPFDRISREDFEKAAAGLKARLPEMKDYEVMVGLARLVALLRDGHSRLTLPVNPAADVQSHTPTAEARAGLAIRALPVKFYLYRDGLHISSTVPELRELLGAKVVKIGDLGASEAVEAVRPIVSFDSEMWVKHMAPEFLRLPEVLRAFGIVRDPAGVPLEVETKEGRRSLTLPPLPRDAAPDWVTWTAFPGGTAPLHLRHPDRPFWFEYRESDRLLYVQVNEIRDDKDETLAAFAARLRAFIDARDVDKLVLDLRFNGGGNNYLNRGLVLALAGSDKVNRYGHLFTLIGRATFSAAISLVSALEHWTETIFAGEPTGNTPSQFGDSRKYTLPRSGLTVRLSSVYWRDWSVNEKRPWVDADLKADTAWDDFAAGRDPALEAVTAYAAPQTLLGRLEERYRWGGMESVVKFYYHVRSTPTTAGTRTETPLIGLAKFLESEKKDGEARDIYAFCLQEYPESLDALLGLGKNYVRSGDKKNAVESFKKALARKPGDAEAAVWLRKAEALPPSKK
jgi:tetratricopeptide (TPR) repeat protein